MQLTICGRYHAHIFSMIAGTPFVSIKDTRKIGLLLDENNLKHHIAAYFQDGKFYTTDFTEAISSILNSKCSSKLKTIAEKNNKELVKTLTSFRQLIC